MAGGPGLVKRASRCPFFRPFAAADQAAPAVNSPNRWRIGEGPGGTAPVTVAIATFNRAPLLRQALESCRTQTVRPERIIVIDDGSIDDTAQTVAAFDGLALHYVNVGKIGLGHARNLATALCTTPWLCILDDDDIMLPNRIADHVAGLSGGANLSHGGWINFNDRQELDYRPGKPVDADVVMYVGNAITHGACFYETAMLREFPYRTDVVGGADFDLAVRAVRSGIRCAHTGTYVLLRRRHEASMSAQAGEGQAAMRRAVVGAIDFRRSDEEIAARTAAARQVAPLAFEPPSLSDLGRALGGFSQPMRIAAFVPRAASSLFDLIARLRPSIEGLEVLDPDPSFGGELALACPATSDNLELAAFDAAFRAQGLRPALLAADPAASSDSLSGPEIPTAADSFRIVLQSESLRELQLAHRILLSQRSWRWYVAAQRRPVIGRSSQMFALVSAEFRKSADDRDKDGRARELSYFIFDRTDLSPRFLEEAEPL
jgi:hypothetical protein